MKHPSAGLPRSTLEAVVEAAVRAPSGDNLQPWRFAWDGERLAVVLDAARDTSLYNVRQLASFVALGAVVENLILAASTHGYDADAVLFPDGGPPGTAAWLSFRPGGVPDPLAQAIPRRCANRRWYDRRPLPPERLSALGNEAARFPGVGIAWLREPVGLKQLARTVARGDRLVFENPRLHGALFSCLRWTAEEADRTRDGLPVETLELGRLATRGFWLLRLWSRVRLLNRLGFSRMAARRNGALMRSASAAGLVTVSGVSPREFLQAGRAVQRLWLAATLQGLALQPMTGFLFLQLRCTLGETQDLAAGHVALLEQTRRELMAVFSLEASRIPVMLFRLGFAPSPSGRTRRRRVSQVLHDASGRG